ncbi:MAG: NAD(P)H-dependent oxidoreductase [Verrucomicrobia bacterium]|nr:NAD(P)H-dependent oxidoreductase [Verrucomicrobiota bacterium]
MRYFIVHAHPEPQSFNGALTRHAVATLREAGHEVEVSDLWAMGFDPVSDRRNFTTVADPAYLKQGAEERYASEHDGFVPALRAEMEKVERCDALVFQCPLWWFGLPAILKGWVERVFAAGRMYGDGKWYENGVGRGKRALLSVTTGGGSDIYADDGLNPKLSAVVAPIQHGIFWFNGFTPMPPFLAWGVSWCPPEQRERYLQEYGERLRRLFDDPAPSYPPAAQFDAETHRDLIPRFMVHWARTGGGNGLDPALQRAHDAAVAAAKDRREVLYEYAADDHSQGWMHVRAKDEESAHQLVESLPLGSQRRHRVTRLARPQ